MADELVTLKAASDDLNVRGQLLFHHPFAACAIEEDGQEEGFSVHFLLDRRSNNERCRAGLLALSPLMDEKNREDADGDDGSDGGEALVSEKVGCEGEGEDEDDAVDRSDDEADEAKNKGARTGITPEAADGDQSSRQVWPRNSGANHIAASLRAACAPPDGFGP